MSLDEILLILLIAIFHLRYCDHASELPEPHSHITLLQQAIQRATLAIDSLPRHHHDGELAREVWTVALSHVTLEWQAHPNLHWGRSVEDRMIQALLKEGWMRKEEGSGQWLRVCYYRLLAIASGL